MAKLISKGLEKLLEKVGFDRLVERGGVKRVLAKSKLDASDIIAKIGVPEVVDTLMAAIDEELALTVTLEPASA